MHQRYTKKRGAKKKDTPMYFIYRHNDETYNLPVENDKGIVIMSVDPGTRNCAVRVERRFPLSTGKPVITLLQTLWDLNPPLKAADKKRLDGDLGTTDIKIFYNFNMHLSTIWDLIKMCDMFVLERQLPINYNATRVCQHLISYCLPLCKSTALIIEVEPRCKTFILKHGEGSDIKDHKDWSEFKCEAILTDRDDTECLEIFHGYKKQDDVSDTVVQVEALCVHLRDTFEKFTY